MEYLGAWGTLIHEKNLKSKISCQTPFKQPKNHRFEGTNYARLQQNAFAQIVSIGNYTVHTFVHPALNLKERCSVKELRARSIWVEYPFTKWVPFMFVKRAGHTILFLA
jgi:hypothetical protein